MSELFPGVSPFSCCAVVQDWIDTDTPMCGATCFTFSCTALSLDNPYHCSIYILLLLFRSLSLLPHLCIQTSPVSTHLSNILAFVQKMQAHVCRFQGYSSVQHLLSYCPATHLPHQRPSSSSGASHFEGDAKSYQMTHKIV